MYFIEPQNLEVVFQIIREHYGRREDVPVYESDREGLSKLHGVLAGVKADYYPDIYGKAAYLIIQINKGHFFANGNKRLALVCTLMFLFSNEALLKERSKDEFRSKLESLFPVFKAFEDDSVFNSAEFAYYNLSIVIAESTLHAESFDSLKGAVEDFIKYSFERPSLR